MEGWPPSDFELRWAILRVGPIKDIVSSLEPLSTQIAEIEENIESIVRRNDIVDEQIQGMKTDILSSSDKILAIKVSPLSLPKINSI